MSEVKYVEKLEDEIVDFFQECIDKVKKESINQ